MPKLREIEAFGSNPGKLRMLLQVPERRRAAPPIVVVLHGCGQTAHGYAEGSGWARLAEHLGAIVVYPEQRSGNDAQTCFSWFRSRDTTRGSGEAQSIREMVEHAIVVYGADRSRVHVTGLSAGGAMTVAMLATYPEVFAAGAVIGGLAYGSADTMHGALAAMLSEQTIQADTLGNRVRQASAHQGPWPAISVWHGESDRIVRPTNALNIIRQWTNLHGLGDIPTSEDTVSGGQLRRIWKDAAGHTVVEAYLIPGMAHGVPISASECGKAGPFFYDVGLSSAHIIAEAWGLSGSVPRRSRPLERSPKTNARGGIAGRAVAAIRSLLEPVDPGR
ncbi:MAG: PHB depolymerase family esterase [Hyphomicrobiaceae bacterium]